MKEGRFSPERPSDLARIFNAFLQTRDPRSLMVHFHDGLVDWAAGSQTYQSVASKQPAPRGRRSRATSEVAE